MNLPVRLDEGAIDTNPVRRVPAPKRRADPDALLRPSKRRALTPEEAGQRYQSCSESLQDKVL